jgi:hypothetical protein
MALYSPGVEIKEVDLTNVIPALATSVGGYAGSFNWGPAGQLVTVSSEKDLVKYFGAPNTASTSQTASFFTAASFLKYGNNLKISRSVENGDDLNAASQYRHYNASDAENEYLNPSQIQIKNKDVYDAINADGTGSINKSAIIARYPGKLGDSLKVVLFRANSFVPDTDAAITPNTANARYNVSGIFSYIPSISTYAHNIAVANGWYIEGDGYSYNMDDEIHVAVIDSTGAFSGTAGTILEKWEGLSLFTDAKTENGATNYYREVINRSSNYIYINNLSNTRITTPGPTGVAIESEFRVTDVTAASVDTDDELIGAFGLGGGVIITLMNGYNGAMASSGMSDAYDMFADSESVPVNLLFGEVSPDGQIALTNDVKLAAIVNARKDCVGFMSAPLSITSQTSDDGKYGEIADKLDATGLDGFCPVSSYMVMDSSPVYVYNKYNDNYVWIPACGHIAGLCANTDAVADAWFSPAGFNRGQLQDVVKLAYNPNQAGRDNLYSRGVNPISAFPGQGIILNGDKTRLAKPSAFDRINVRRLFITIEKAIATASKYQLFEQNDDFTRAAFKNMIEPYLRDVKGRRGITDYRVVCDSSNNDGEVVDGNRFVADIYIKPTHSINFITLNFIATRTGVEFKEIVG